MSYKRVGVVTGANKGIGLAIVRQLQLQYPKSPLNNGPLLIYLTARDKSRGEAAIQTLKDENLKTEGLSEVKFHPLDITDKTSIQTFADHMKDAHGEKGIDFVINNAGIAMNGFDANVVKTTLACNYYGTLNASAAFLPLLKPGGRLVNVASMAGHLTKYSQPLTSRFRAAKTVEDVSKLMEEFQDAVGRGKEKEEGWPSAGYAVSKCGLIGATRALAEEERRRGDGVLVNSCCPGWVVTDMTKGKGSKSVDEGAQTPVMLAVGEVEGRTGEFWQHEKVIEW